MPRITISFPLALRPLPMLAIVSMLTVGCSAGQMHDTPTDSDDGGDGNGAETGTEGSETDESGANDSETGDSGSEDADSGGPNDSDDDDSGDSDSGNDDSSGDDSGSEDSGDGDSGDDGDPGECDPGTTETEWATTCPTAPPQSCVDGTWTAWGSSSPENYPFRYETEHFAFYWPDERNVDMQQAEAAGAYLEDVVWATFMGDPIYFPEPDCERADKRKVSIHIIESGLFGGCNQGRPGIWVGPGALADHWGLAHEFTHSLQCMTPGVPDCGPGGCWLHESHANFMPHQLEEYRDDVHCSEMLVNMPHLYYGSTRDRYCNWQFWEFLKDKHCYSAVNGIWDASDVPDGLADPFNKLAHNMGWDAEDLNDLFGEWAMHNITWDYQNPPPTTGDNQGPTYRQRYGPPTDTSRPERHRRVTRLEPLDDEWSNHRRFVSPYFWAPQRWGYNLVRLVPEEGATEVAVTFRGILQDGADSGWRWGLVATTDDGTTARYSQLKRGADGELSFCLEGDEALWMVIVGAPTEIQKIVWDQPYPSIYRYPYMVQIEGAWPQGFEGGVRGSCPSGTQRHSNGNGCAPLGLPDTVHVAQDAVVLGGNVSGAARIEDHAIIMDGATVSGGTVGALSILSRFTVSDSATVQTTFYPPGFFESGQGLSGTARLYGDVEYRGAGLNRSSGSYYGFVDSNTQSASIDDVTTAPPYTWRP